MPKKLLNIKLLNIIRLEINAQNGSFHLKWNDIILILNFDSKFQNLESEFKEFRLWFRFWFSNTFWCQFRLWSSKVLTLMLLESEWNVRKFGTLNFCMPLPLSLPLLTPPSLCHVRLQWWKLDLKTQVPSRMTVLSFSEPNFTCFWVSICFEPVFYSQCWSLPPWAPTLVSSVPCPSLLQV